MPARELFFASICALGVYGHGRLTTPVTRLPAPIYENNPVSGPGGTDFVCRNDPDPTRSGANAQITVQAGEELLMQWDLSAPHQGDCAIFVGYGPALTEGKGETKRAGEFVKIANVYNCREYTGKPYAVDLPDWLPAGPAVIRWQWYAIHVHPKLEWYTQCSDVIVESQSPLTPADLPSFPIVDPQLLPARSDDRAVNFRCSWCQGVQNFQAGVPCTFPGMATDRAQCGNTAPGTLGFIDPFDLGGQGTPAPVVAGATPAPVVAPQPTPAPVGGTGPQPTPAPVDTTTGGDCTNGNWAACGGIDFTGPTCCPAGTQCQREHQWYSQCRSDGCPVGWECENDGPATTPSPTPAQDPATPSPTASQNPPQTPSPTSSQNPPAPTPGPTHKPTDGADPPTTVCPDEDPSVLNIIGYYGNSGGQGCPNNGCIPAIPNIPVEYNVLVLTFINFFADGSIDFLIGGPHAKGDLPAVVQAWKDTKDPWNRPRHALVSLGGQNGNWPAGVAAGTVLQNLVQFLEHYHLDGLDVDLEGGALAGAATVAQVVEGLRAQCYLVGAAPEAAQSPLDSYKGLLHDLNWVHPQFYNNGPNAVTTPWTGRADNTSPRPIGWNPTATWQDTCTTCPTDEPFWYTILLNIGFEGDLKHPQLGMLVPATELAAGNNNRWFYDDLAANVDRLGLKHVGTWAVGHDSTANYQFARSYTAVLDRRFAATRGGRGTRGLPKPTPAPTDAPGIPPFDSFGEFKVWCSTSADAASCKACLGKFKTRKGKSKCHAPKKAKKMKCKKIQDSDLCAAVGCTLRRTKCTGRAFS